MLLENLKQLIQESETPIESGFKDQYYSFIALYDSIIKLDEILTFKRGKLEEVLKEAPDAIYYCLRFMNDYGIPINSEQFSFDQFRSEIKFYQKPGITDHKYYINPLFGVFGKLSTLLKKEIKQNNSLLINEKTLIVNYLYNILSNILLLIDYLHLNIEMVLGSLTEKIKIQTSTKEKTGGKGKGKGKGKIVETDDDMPEIID